MLDLLCRTKLRLIFCRTTILIILKSRVKLYQNRNRFPSKLLDCPSQFPDQSPIESLRSILDKKIRENQANITNREQLSDELQKAWSKKGQSKLQKQVHSMPSRCAKVIQAQSPWTKY